MPVQAGQMTIDEYACDLEVACGHEMPGGTETMQGEERVMSLHECMEFAISNSTKMRIQEAETGNARLTRREALLDAFLPGMGCFALAHLALIGGFLAAGGISLGPALLFAAFLSPLLYLLIRFRKSMNPFPAFVVYAVLLCAMAALSYGQSPLAGIGGLLFVLSDSILGCRRAGLRMPRFSSALCLGAYWSGLTLIAFSLLV